MRTKPSKGGGNDMKWTVPPKGSLPYQPKADMPGKGTLPKQPKWHMPPKGK